MSEHQVLILLPVYNGARYLRPQLDSVLAQTFSSFHVLCRDDGSSDESMALLQSYAQQHPQKFTVFAGDKRLGASGSYSCLMEAALKHPFANSPDCYIALCDQDDIWHPDRLRSCIDTITAVENPSDNNSSNSALDKTLAKALIVHSDLRVIDGQGQEIASSFMAYQGLHAEQTLFRSQLLSNTITGCTCLFNMALLRLAAPIPDKAIMHDWWLALTASAFGQIIPIKRALVDYRQHDSNTLGAREFQQDERAGTLLDRLLNRSDEQYFLQLADQAQAFGQRHAGRLSRRCRMRLWMINFLLRRQLLISRVCYHLLRRF
ncbi:MAG: glycosyltransferase family 2 protein [Pseudomonadales bacterium]|nr:glycosyltransferase family 2 protein [Pseudomonadales bacterium]